MKIWLDDIREPPDYGWEWAATFGQFVWIIRRCHILGNGVPRNMVVPEVISFDHDLGINPNLKKEVTGYDAIKWLVSMYPHLYPNEVRVHSANPVGAENIRKYDENYRRRSR